MIYYAHTAEDADGQRLPESSGEWQLLRDHLKNVAEVAGKFAAPFGAEEEARLAGLLHDLGKYAAATGAAAASFFRLSAPNYLFQSVPCFGN